MSSCWAAGADILQATGSGRNLMIGGLGADTLSGNGNSLLISGSTTLDTNSTALDAILAEWASSDSYSSRVAAILNGGGLNGSFKLTKSTVIDDLATNLLSDSSGATQDQFVVNVRDAVTQQPGETKTVF